MGLYQGVCGVLLRYKMSIAILIQVLFLWLLTACNSYNPISPIEQEMQLYSLSPLDPSKKQVVNYSFVKVNENEYELHSLDWISNIKEMFLNLKNQNEIFDSDSIYYKESAFVSNESALDFSSTVKFSIVENGGVKKNIQFRLVSPQSSGLPIVSISTASEVKNREDFVKASFEIIDYKNPVHNISRNLTQYGIRGRGNSTWTRSPKKPYLIKFDKKTSLFGLAPHKRWVLLANYFDKSLYRNELALSLGKSVLNSFEWVPTAHSVELFLNGKYNGTYQLIEDKRVGEGRIEIDQVTELGDLLLELDSRAKDKKRDYFVSSKNLMFSLISPKTQANKHYAETLINEIEDKIFGKDFKDPLNGYRSVLDMSTFVDWFILNEFFKDRDAFKLSSFMYYIKNESKLYMSPLWDFDLGGGNDSEMDCANTEGFFVKKTKWFEQLFKDPYFQKLVRDRFDEKKDALLEKIETIEENSAYLKLAANNNFKKWDILGKKIWINRVWPETYTEEVQELQKWLLARFYWLDENL